MFSSRTRKAALLAALSTAIFVFPAVSFARCPGVHHGSSKLGWDKPFRSDAWPYYEKNRGAIRLKGVESTDRLIINGCDAGSADKNKTVYLDPGNYDVTVKSGNGQSLLSRQMSVQNGMRVDLTVRQQQ